MAVKLRLMRMGKKKQPTYRLVAADSRSPRDGRFIEAVGVYAPRGRSSADRDAVVQIDEVKVIRWLSDGAKPTDRVERILQQLGTLDRFRSGEGPRTEAVTAGGPAPSGRPAAAADKVAPAPPEAVAPASDTPVPAAEVPAAEVPAAEVPAAEVPAAEVPAAEAPAAEVPAAEAPTADADGSAGASAGDES